MRSSHEQEPQIFLAGLEIAVFEASCISWVHRPTVPGNLQRSSTLDGYHEHLHRR
ncbi:hypothetical protein GCM10011588_17650 [Nocardia jinanensis]|uniref:Uncharacterized protein n=1 Tax=Nocardia jinanensis TaxID=382504 RepID=A0A917RDZ5_9NOCA|nr:hypothetical protein GCM10011588_17650 [Nocardia jinanensis]